METRDPRIEWNDRPIVRVEATVMVRGELGWTPHLGAGHSKVAIYESVVRTEYRLYGYKIQDQSVTLDALIPPRMSFTKASLIFHHWVIGNERMGLAFNGTADARSFDRGVRVALENLEKACFNMSSSSSTCSRTSDEPASPTSTQSFTLPYSDDAARSDSQSPPATSSATRQPALLPRQLMTTTLPKVPAFRQQIKSASSSRQRPTPPTRTPRRHSSSIPGRAHRSVSTPPQPISPISSPCATELPISPSFLNCSPPSTPESPLRDAEDEKKETGKLPPPVPTDSIQHRSRRPVTSSRRHRSRHHRQESNSHHRSRRTKTPNLDNLERQRGLEPTKPNSYVQIASKSSRGTTAAISRSGAAIPFNRRITVNEDSHIKYHIPRYVIQRPVGGTLNDYWYHGLKTSDESHTDLYGKSYYHTSPSFSSYSDPGSIVKLKGSDYGDRRGGKYKEDLGERSRCRNCLVMFNHDRNKPGSCPEAPSDNFQVCLERASCMSAAHAVLYNCFSDSEGNYDQEPCSCSRQYNGDSPRRRWFVLALISIFVPCLCLYPILKGCHRCGVACHCCGGRHQAMPLRRDSPGNPGKCQTQL